MQDCPIRTVISGFATPMLANPERRTFRGAIFDAQSQLVTESQRTRHGDNEWNPDDPANCKEFNSAQKLSGRSLYLGHYTGHYGHFLLETLNRVWPLLTPGRVKLYDHFVFHPFLHDTPDPLSFSPAKVCFQAFGIDPARFHLIQQPTFFGQIDIPAPQFDINHSVNPVMTKVYQTILKHGLSMPTSKIGWFQRLRGWPDSGELKLYISRRKAKGYHPVENDEQVQSVFKAMGFRIFHPEKWSFEQQLALIQRAHILAGTEGSALHNSVFMRPKCHVLTIGTPRVPSGRILNQDLCNGLSGVQNHYIEFKGQETVNYSAIYDTQHLRLALNQWLIGLGESR